MAHNKIKIVSNNSTVFYYIQNEEMQWVRVSNSSELSRREYTHVCIKEKVFDILQIINDSYNPGNRGVDLYFEGCADEFYIICNALAEKYDKENITCYHKTMKIAVVGKIGSGKTTLIKEMFNINNSQYKKIEGLKYDIFYDKKRDVEWYELNGIDLGRKNIEDCKQTLTKLAKNEITTLIYCFSTTKIERLEEELILYISNNYPQIKILILLTKYIYDDGDLFARQINEIITNAKVIPILAKDLQTRNGTISSFGLEEISKYIFEGR